MTDFPRRIRVRGGRNTHAAQRYTNQRRPHQNRGWDSITACDRVCDTTHERFADHRLPDDTPVTCKACARALSAKEA